MSELKSRSTSDDHHFSLWPAHKLAAALRARAVSCRELLEVCLEQIDQLNPTLNAVVVEDREAALSQADAADAALARGEEWGPLHGLPMTVKESFDVAGWPTTWGRPDLADHRPQRTAAAVQRLQDAGAILLGKTNVPLLLADWQTYNAVYGTTRNPWDRTRTPGGSSGGSAAALATGMAAVEIGTDIGGSIRNPAHYCGVFGHKPSYGIVPLTGHKLPGVRAVPDLSVAGPLARSAADLDLFLSVLAGPDGSAARAWRLQLPQAGKTRLREFKVGLFVESSASAVDSRYLGLIARLVDDLRAAGATVVEGARPPFDDTQYHETYIQLLRAVTTARQPESEVEEARKAAAALDPADRSYVALQTRATILSHRDWIALNERREALREVWAAWFEEVDLLLCPCAASTAFPLDETPARELRTIPVSGERVDYNDQLFWAGMASLSYLPASVAPIGIAEGLPGGIQIIGRHLDDRTPIAFARALEAEIRSFTPPPIAHSACQGS